MADEETKALIRDVLTAVENGFRENGERLAALEARVDEAHAGVRMALAGIEGVQQKVDTLADGVLQLSAQISEVRAGVADQVRLEVEKQADGERSFASLPDKL